MITKEDISQILKSALAEFRISFKAEVIEIVETSVEKLAIITAKGFEDVHAEIKAIKEVMATKEDLKGYATKEDLQKLEAKMATKENLEDMEERLTMKHGNRIERLEDGMRVVKTHLKLS
jgi:hypothetical protein